MEKRYIVTIGHSLCIFSASLEKALRIANTCANPGGITILLVKESNCDFDRYWRSYSENCASCFPAIKCNKDDSYITFVFYDVNQHDFVEEYHCGCELIYEN